MPKDRTFAGAWNEGGRAEAAARPNKVAAPANQIRTSTAALRNRSPFSSPEGTQQTAPTASHVQRYICPHWRDPQLRLPLETTGVGMG